MPTEGLAETCGVEEGFFVSFGSQAVRMSQNAIRHKTTQRSRMERRIRKFVSVCSRALQPFSAPKPKTGGHAEHHAAKQGHDDEGEPSGRFQTLPVNEPRKQKHQRKRFDDEHEGNRVRHRGDDQIPTRDGQIDKGSIGDHEAEDGHHEEQCSLGLAKGKHNRVLRTWMNPLHQRVGRGVS